MKAFKSLIEEGFIFDSRRYIFEAWALFKQNATSYLGFVVLSTAIQLTLSFVPSIGSILGTFVVSPALGLGYYLATHQIKSTGSAAFSDFFGGFQYIVQVSLLTGLTYAIYLLVLSPTLFNFYQSGLLEWYQQLLDNPLEAPTDLPDLPQKTSTVFFLNLIPLVFLSIAFVFSTQFLIFYKVNFLKALEYSRALVTKKWWAVFRMFLSFISLFFVAYFPIALIATLIPSLGVFLLALLVIAAYFLIPVLYIALYIAFADITQLTQDQEEHPPTDFNPIS
jgi:hypothetical protein